MSFKLMPLNSEQLSSKSFFAFLQLIDGNGTIPAELLAASGIEMGSEVTGEINDGTVLYIDPNDPQAAALLQQAGNLVIPDQGSWVILRCSVMISH